MGHERIEAMIERRELRLVPDGAGVAEALLLMASRHVEAARMCASVDAEGAYTLAYDAARKSGAALLARQGLRATRRGGHVAVIEAVDCQFPDVPGLRSLDRLRRRSSRAEYPDPAAHDPITSDEAADAIALATAAARSARQLIDRPGISLFC